MIIYTWVDSAGDIRWRADAAVGSVATHGGVYRPKSRTLVTFGVSHDHKICQVGTVGECLQQVYGGGK